MQKTVTENFGLHNIISWIDGDVRNKCGPQARMEEWMSWKPENFSRLDLETWWSAWYPRALELKVSQDVLLGQFHKALASVAPIVVSDLLARDKNRPLQDQYKIAISRAVLNEQMRSLGYDGDGFQKICKVSYSEKTGLKRM